MSDFREALVLAVADALMKYHGNDKYNTAAIEWDPNEPDSQYAMTLEDAKLSVKTVLDIITDETLNEMYDDEEEFEEDEVLVEGPKHAHRAPNAVTSSAALFIFMQTEPGVPVHVGDVREWLAAVDEASIPDNTEIEGHLHLSYDLRGDGISIEKIECLECGYKDTLVSEHRH